MSRGEINSNRVFKLSGLSETLVLEKLNDLATDHHTSIVCQTGPGEVRVIITIQAENSAFAEKQLEIVSLKVRESLDEYIFACDEEIIEESVGHLLRQGSLTLATAESCTGGLIAARITDLPGSSDYFKGGVVAYTNEIKQKFLGVPADVLEEFSAVSSETACAMAEGIRTRAASDFGLSVTGIAGPSGDSPGKPVGLVYIGFCTPEGVTSNRYIFPGNRNDVRQGTANTALNILKRYLEKQIL
ncbi:MAG: nicotinamide-nucleotide amidohydrolase family protein [Pelotomaculum sp.]